MAKQVSSSKKTTKSTGTSPKRRVQLPIPDPDPDPEPEPSGFLAGLNRWWHGYDFRAKTYLDYDDEDEFDDEDLHEEHVDELDVYEDGDEEGDDVDDEEVAEVDEKEVEQHEVAYKEDDEELQVVDEQDVHSREHAPKVARKPVSVAFEEQDKSIGVLAQRYQKSAGVPDRYNDGIQWLRSGVRRHPTAVIVGLVFGWTGAWLAFWGAMAGAFLGALVGLGVGSANIPIFRTFGLGQSVSVVGVVAGVAVGVLGGFLVVLVFLVMHPLPLLGSFVSGTLIAALLVAASASYERAGLRMRGYRRLSRDEVRRVAPVVKRAADAMELPSLPRFAIAQQVIPNAWTHMRTIVLTTGLLQTLDDGELEAVLIHELTHWRNGDAVGLQCVWAAAWPVFLLYNLGVAVSGNSPKNQMGMQIKVSSAFRWIIAWLIAWPAWIMTKVIIAPLTAASQRRYEYAADAAAYKLGLGPQLTSALQKMGAFEGGRTGWEAAMTATHPPTELRIEALQSPRPDDWEYQEEELHGPSWDEIRRIFRGVAQPFRNSSTR
jgi:Zn-dependent protease with chaperone function